MTVEIERDGAAPAAILAGAGRRGFAVRRHFWAVGSRPRRMLAQENLDPGSQLA